MYIDKTWQILFEQFLQLFKYFHVYGITTYLYNIHIMLIALVNKWVRSERKAIYSRRFFPPSVYPKAT